VGRAQAARDAFLDIGLRGSKSMPSPLDQEAIRARCFHPYGKFVEFPKEDVETSLAERFEKIVERFPDRVAVSRGDRALTYSELNQAANRLAHALLARRGSREETIALLMDHDVSLMVAIVGVLKAGKICLVLDPGFPKARVGFLLEDSQAGLLITDPANLSLASEYAHEHCEIVNIADAAQRFSIENPGVPLAPDRIAFLLYTSGSTGQPKGAIQNHRNLLHDSMLYCNGLHICPEDRLALVYLCSTSQGVKITLVTLMSGASLHLFNVQQKGVAGLASWLDREEITIYFSVPAVFRQLTDTLDRKRPWSRLRIVQLGSDLVTIKELEAYQAHFSAETILVVRLGTTETGTLRRIYFDVESPLAEAAGAVGYATDDVHVWLRDGEGAEVKVGNVGEIVVKSRYISPGYWRRPDLTREKFVPDPNGGAERIFHTGDLGRLRPDGLLYHLGRKDFQLSIRGYRVEAGEIEAVMLAQRNVEQAVVVPAKASPDAERDRLIAYIVAREKPLPSRAALRTAAREKLPAYMVPSAFVFLDALPLTSNGKVDRGALARAELKRSNEESPEAPRTSTERRIAEIWSQVLKLDALGIHDDFFELGGDSLLATQVMSRLAEVFGTELSVRSLFEHPTVAGCAAQIAETQTQSGTEKDTAIT
jgi:amino acid adenylation domain-containing protein